MRLLVVTAPPPWPPRSGYRIRCWEITKRLAATHDVALVSVGEAGLVGEEPPGGWASVADWWEIVPGARTTPWTLARAALSRMPHHAATHAPEELAAAVARAERAVGPFDAVLSCYLYFAPRLPAASPWLLDQHNVDHEVWEGMAAAARGPARWFLARQARLMRAFERRWLPEFAAIASVSQEDARETRRVLAEADGDPTRVFVAPNGADFSRALPAERPVGPPTAIFTGTAARRNVDGLTWLLREAWPDVRRAVPEARLLVVGELGVTDLPADVRRAPGLEVVGPVARVEPWLDAADVAVVPVRRGGGSKLKAFEALAAGLPVVTTPGGGRGLEGPGGGHWVVAGDAASYAAAVVGLLSDPERARRIGRAGRDACRASHDWEGIVARLNQPLERLAAGAATGLEKGQEAADSALDSDPGDRI